ncbi:MAG: carboxymuconolactone decarboxylase family protein [Methanobacterium sp.]
MKYMYRSKRKNELSPKFIERIMLEVTMVNDCSLCSHAHTKRALEYGMSCDEIRNILAGSIDDIPEDEVQGVVFAKHYADSRGNPSQKAWQRIVDIYGISKALGILGSIRTIMIGNTYGLPWSSFFNRFRGKADPRSSLKYEISMMLGTLLAPISLFHALISDLLKNTIISF